MRSEIDWRAVAEGAAVSIGWSLVLIVVANIAGVGTNSDWILVLYPVHLLGAIGGGAVAARDKLDTPLMHGALAGAVAYVVIGTISTLINVAAGHGAPSVAVLVFNTFMLASFGLLGGFLAARRAADRARRPPAP